MNLNCSSGRSNDLLLLLVVVGIVTYNAFCYLFANYFWAWRWDLRLSTRAGTVVGGRLDYKCPWVCLSVVFCQSMSISLFICSFVRDTFMMPLSDERPSHSRDFHSSGFCLMITAVVNKNKFETKNITQFLLDIFI